MYVVEHIREQPLNAFTKVGSEFEVSVQEFYSPKAFFVHLSDEGYLPLLKETKGEMEQLYNKSENHERYRIPLSKCVQGRYCSVQHKDDKGWYRAIILKVKDTTMQAKV